MKRQTPVPAPSPPPLSFQSLASPMAMDGKRSGGPLGLPTEVQARPLPNTPVELQSTSSSRITTPRARIKRDYKCKYKLKQTRTMDED